MDKPSVFISYSRQDRSLADQLIMDLRRAGVDVWSDQDIRPGQRWEEEIEAALARANVFVLLASPDYLASNWSMIELGAALGRARSGNASLIPVTLHGAELPGLLRGYNAIDADVTPSAQIADRISAVTRQP